MDKYRKKKAAEARRRKARNTRIAGTVIGIAACALITFAGVRFINARMDNASAQQYQAVLPTQLPQGTLAPVHTDYINATPAPTTAALSADELNAGDGWMQLLVNSSNAIPDGYAPTELTELSNGQSVDKRIYPSLQSMFDDARAQGVYPVVSSGYRTAKQQQSEMDDKIQEYIDDGKSEDEARALAATYVAQVGYSEHEAGLAIDIVAKANKSDDDTVWAWMKEHCAEYGFILRYPEGKEGVTGMSYEPWHFRYVGVEAAQKIMGAGITLEEYLGQVN
jgi:zinc D-Ala-D-Ala carboxypeptidase